MGGPPAWPSWSLPAPRMRRRPCQRYRKLVLAGMAAVSSSSMHHAQHVQVSVLRVFPVLSYSEPHAAVRTSAGPQKPGQPLRGAVPLQPRRGRQGARQVMRRGNALVGTTMAAMLRPVVQHGNDLAGTGMVAMLQPRCSCGAEEAGAGRGPGRWCGVRHLPLVQADNVLAMRRLLCCGRSAALPAVFHGQCCSAASCSSAAVHGSASTYW